MSEGSSDDAVRFEIVDLTAAAGHARRLALNWSVTLHERRGVNLVTVELRPRPTDVADLLREVERWIAEESLHAIRFDLDGRGYVLEAGDADWGAGWEDPWRPCP
jgi:hypothetical protein